MDHAELHFQWENDLCLQEIFKVVYKLNGIEAQMSERPIRVERVGVAGLSDLFLLARDEKERKREEEASEKYSCR